MAYATAEQLRQMLVQGASNETDATLNTFLERATDAVELVLGFKFAGYLSEAAERKVESPDRRAYLRLPYYEAGSLASVSLGGTAITDYEVDDDDHRYLYRAAGWPAGRYTASAKWGYGAPPPAVVEVVLEMAVNLLQGRARGMWTDVQGVEGGGAVGYARALTNAQGMVLGDVRRKYIGWGFA